MASVLHVDSQKGRFWSKCIVSGLWVLQGAEDIVPMCDQNVAAHPQHSICDLAPIQGH